MICDYTYYIETYNGSYFTDESTFNRFATRATQYIATQTTIPDPAPDIYKNCCCSIAEMMGKHSEGESVSLRGVSSESVAGYSVSYGAAATASTGYLPSLQDELIFWLGSGAVKCRGVGRHVL